MNVGERLGVGLRVADQDTDPADAVCVSESVGDEVGPVADPLMVERVMDWVEVKVPECVSESVRVGFLLGLKEVDGLRDKLFLLGLSVRVLVGEGREREGVGGVGLGDGEVEASARRLPTEGDRALQMDTRRQAE